MNKMFTNKISISGGTNCNRRKALHNVDMNETSSQKMFVYNKHGGKKLKGGSDCPTCGIKSYVSNLFKPLTSTGPIAPPPALPSNVPVINLKSIPASQQMLMTQEISTMNPMNKFVEYPTDTTGSTVAAYKGPFSYGGAKTKKVKKAKTTVAAAKKPTKPKAKAKAKAPLKKKPVKK
jgi:hypothetical protein